MITHLDIKPRVPGSADLSMVSGLDVSLEDGALRPGADLVIEEDFVRPLSALAKVLAAPIEAPGDRSEYRMLNGVRREQDSHLDGLPWRYELTAMTGAPLGWEAAKTAGHTHVRAAGASLGYPEVVEVLHGEAGFLMQDLRSGTGGPTSTRAWIVRAGPGDWVLFPPGLAHVTIDLGVGPLVFSDVIDREAAGMYDAVAAARGFAWYVGADGELRANDRYLHTPPIEVCSAREWSGPAPGPLYEAFRDDPKRFSWLSDGDAFPDVAALVWERVGETVTSLG